MPPKTASQTEKCSLATMAAVVGCLVSGCEETKQFAKDVLGVQSDDQLDIDGPRPGFLPDVGGAAEPEQAPLLPKQPLDKALAKYPFLAKGAPNLGFKLTSLDELRALVVEPEIPEWGAAQTGDAALALDGDLDTAWTCTPAELTPCAIGLHLPRGGEVKAVQLFAAGGVSGAANDRHPRPKKIRLHTAQGFAEANVPDSDDSVYVVLGRDVSTPNIVVEFVEFWKGSTEEMRLGEVKLLGLSGDEAPALNLDPDRTFVTWEGVAWRKKGAQHRPATPFVRTVDPDGTIRTVAQGSALRGQAGDRILLLEHLEDSSCTRAEGTVDLLDQHTHVVAPLGELGGVAGDLFRQAEGLGVALGYTDEFSTTLAGVVVDPERGYVVKRTPRREDKRETDTFGNWGFEPLIVPRTGTPLGGSNPGCEKATPEHLELVTNAMTSAGEKAPAPTGDHWVTCTVGASIVLLSDGGTCGDAWRMVAVNEDGAYIGGFSQKHRGSHIRLRRLSDKELLIEATGKDESATLFRSTPDSLEPLTERGALAMPPPGACRAECGDGFPNPNAPNW